MNIYEDFPSVCYRKPNLIWHGIPSFFFIIPRGECHSNTVPGGVDHLRNSPYIRNFIRKANFNEYSYKVLFKPIGVELSIAALGMDEKVHSLSGYPQRLSVLFLLIEKEAKI